MAIIRTVPVNDLALDENGAFIFIDGPQLIRQRIASRFKFFLGEWFLDIRQGVPYYRDVLIKNPNLAVVRSIFRNIIISTPGVLSLDSFTMDFNRSTYTLTYDFQATVTGGTVTVSPTDDDFIVEVIS